MLASDKCYRLALALYSKAPMISSEEVETAANYIAQCATNVLSVRQFTYLKAMKEK